MKVVLKTIIVAALMFAWYIFAFSGLLWILGSIAGNSTIPNLYGLKCIVLSTAITLILIFISKKYYQ